jgi:hypothetical protein
MSTGQFKPNAVERIVLAKEAQRVAHCLSVGKLWHYAKP